MNKFKNQKGAVALATILLVFTVCGLISSAVKTGQAIYNNQQIQQLAKQIKTDALYLRHQHPDNPTIVAQADAWDKMADLMFRHGNKAFGQTALNELTANSINLVPGALPIAKGSRELVELSKDVYDVAQGLKSAYGEAKEPSAEMKEFFKIIARGKISADALQIAMMKTRAQALNQEVVKLQADLKAQEDWQEQQKKHLANYEQLFINNSLKSAKEQLKKNGQLSSYYKNLFTEERFKKQLANYPQLTEAIKKIDDLTTVSEAEMQALDQVAIETIQDDEIMPEALGSAITQDSGDWQQNVLQMMSKVMEASIMPQLGKESKEKYNQQLKACEELKKKAQAQREYGEQKQKEDQECSQKCGPAMINGSINSAALDCINNCMSQMDITAGVEAEMADWEYQECLDEAKQWLFSQ